MRRRQRNTGGTGAAASGAVGGAEGGSRSIAMPSERDADAHVHTHPAHLLPVREVQLERADGAAPAEADAVAPGRMQLAPAVGGVAGVREDGPPEGRPV